MVENSSRQLYQGPSFLVDMFGYNIANHATPFGVFFAGLVTVICMVFTFLYLQRKALQSAVSARAENRSTREAESSDEEVTQSPDIKSWPLDEELKKTDRMTDKEIDALNFCGHIPAEIKKARVKATKEKIEHEMTLEQKEEEKRLQREQLKAIFDMMADQQEKFGVKSAEDLNEQMRLYM